jgi:asparagine synthase (glutamine-hydrolysing)
VNRVGEFDGSLADAAMAVRDALQHAVELRMLRADVPVGSYLSGGLDSSLIAAMGHRLKGNRFSTFSIRFEDAEYDETSYQHEVAARLGTDHHELVVRYRDLATVFPEVIRHAERPLLRTGAAAMYVLSGLVHEAGVKVVLTGEGADEMFACYDLFREAKVRRFWGRQPGSAMRPRLIARLYPHVSRSPIAAQQIAAEFFGQDRERWAEPGFSHAIRWRSAAALQRLFSSEMREAARSVDVTARLLSDLPSEFGQWSFLAQDQYLEIRTLLSGYVLASQGDRMLMAHSVEGRFPFLDTNVGELAERLPARYKLMGLSEKHVLKVAAEGLVPEDVIRRSKQPFRAPDAISFVGPGIAPWVDEVISDRAVLDAGVFDPRAVASLWRKSRDRTANDQFSNADNMALVGVLSTGLLHQAFIRDAPAATPERHYTTVVDRLAPPALYQRPRAALGGISVDGS